MSMVFLGDAGVCSEVYSSADTRTMTRKNKDVTVNLASVSVVGLLLQKKFFVSSTKRRTRKRKGSPWWDNFKAR